MDTLEGLKRTHYCGDVENTGAAVTVGGFVQKIRDMDHRAREFREREDSRAGLAVRNGAFKIIRSRLSRGHEKAGGFFAFFED